MPARRAAVAAAETLAVREAQAAALVSHKDELRDASDRHAKSLCEAQERFTALLREQKHADLSVTIHPFVNTNKQKGLFASETLIEIGYKYQLLVQGLPCFEPHAVVIETTREKEVNDETIELLKNKAFELAQLAASSKSGGLATAFSIAKATVSRIK